LEMYHAGKNKVVCFAVNVSRDWHWQQNKQLYSYLCGTFPNCMM
jgi:hypothetical protein